MLLQTRNTGPLTGRRPVPGPTSKVQSPSQNLSNFIEDEVDWRTLDVGPWTWDIIAVQNMPPSVHRLSG